VKTDVGRLIAGGVILSAVVRKRYTIRFATPDSAYINRCGAEGSCWMVAPPGTAQRARTREREGSAQRARHWGAHKGELGLPPVSLSRHISAAASGETCTAAKAG
jgi:hypothetical protein